MYTFVSVKKWHVESLTLEHIMTTFLKACQMHEHGGNPILGPMGKKMISPPFENILVRVHFS